MQTGNLASGTAHAQSCNGNFRWLYLLLHLFEDRAIAFAGGADRVTVGAQINRGQHGVVGIAHQHCFGGGGADIKTQDAGVLALNASGCQGFKFHLICIFL